MPIAQSWVRIFRPEESETMCHQFEFSLKFDQIVEKPIQFVQNGSNVMSFGRSAKTHVSIPAESRGGHKKAEHAKGRSPLLFRSIGAERWR